MRARELLLEGLQTAFRLFPWPTEAGLRKLGQPDSRSPVLLTGNYDLSVRRLVRAMEGRDAWLLVAPSGGINVWCAASGGHLTTHQVVTALKTSGIADEVEHRDVILPQLAATGVLALDVFRRTRWRVRFGPVAARQLPEYLGDGEKTDAMRRVDFSQAERLQMAVMWAVPTSVVVAGLALLIQPAWTLPLTALVWALSVGVFAFYDRLGDRRRALAFGIAAGSALALTALCGGGAGALGCALVASLGLVALLTFDYSGSTPIEGGSHFEERAWKIQLDAERCQGVYRCVEVCPEACFAKPEQGRKVELVHDERCIRCGACIVQCPKDALFFEKSDGSRVEAEQIRRFKLNLLGSRSVEAG